MIVSRGSVRWFDKQIVNTSITSFRKHYLCECLQYSSKPVLPVTAAPRSRPHHTRPLHPPVPLVVVPS